MNSKNKKLLEKKNRVKILALQGGFDDATSKGISEILSYFGGQNKSHFDYKEKNEIYFYIDDTDFSIHRFNILDPSCAELFNRYDFIKYSVSHFKELYPYVPGDRVELLRSGEIKSIQRMEWDFANGQVVYGFSAPSGKIDFLQRSAIRQKIITDDKKGIENNIENPRLFENKDGNLEIHYDKSIYETKETAEGIVLVKKGVLHLFPQTYEDCCKYLKLDPAESKVSGYLEDSLTAFQRVILCRNVWYVIMRTHGLLKIGNLYSIGASDSGKIIFDSSTDCVDNLIYKFNFPIEEIRDGFYKCFEEDLKKCVLFI